MSLLRERIADARQSARQPCPFGRAACGRPIARWPLGKATHQLARTADVRARVAEASTPNTSTGDVYVVDPKPLEEGVEKHIISIFVADEPGLINRVAGVFARRGSNIESLAVGLTRDKALFTCVVAGKANTVATLIKQLSKLVSVRYVEDITVTNRIERELLLVKLRAEAGTSRTEVLELGQVFRARVVDVGDSTLSLAVTGDPGKLTAMLKALSKYGIVELTRTGRICLRRGEPSRQRLTVNAETAQAEALAEAAAMPAASAAHTSSGNRGADVYAVESMDTVGVWDVDNVLEATYSGGELPADIRAYTLSIEVQDVPGVLNQVTQVFARRGYNVQSLAVGPSEREGMSRIVMVVPGKASAADGKTSGIEGLLKQLRKLVWVTNVIDLTDTPFVNRELILVKVRCNSATRGELRDLAAIFRGSIVDVSAGSITIEVLGKEDKMKAFTDLLQPYGVLEIARTGRIAMARDSGVNSEFLEKMSMGRVW
ncbi:hypothetical protein HYH03_005433 [Edaphochlamys debaryana]|uniref:ACT domain-containing protein n=1 Tax=Edaphochlamys debaryana TaxID=47281 RepID=A0A835Y7T3_9CHLO|nr:hypothetical protein HYH03_005433 [Edaphochlamys debaryana]|eukprot:KAG2496612.1 hypothetical protein HYH03_005433 [Edaphochlamys debaryana]